MVITRLDEETLRKVAAATGGDYYRTSDAGLEMVQIYRVLEENEEVEFSSKVHRQREDRYQYFLLSGILLLSAAYSLGNRSYRKLRRTQQEVAS